MRSLRATVRRLLLPSIISRYLSVYKSLTNGKIQTEIPLAQIAFRNLGIPVDDPKTLDDRSLKAPSINRCVKKKTLYKKVTAMVPEKNAVNKLRMMV